MTYDEALAFIYGLTDFERDRSGLFRGHQDLRHVEALLAALGDPQRLPALHVAGSKGKGSVAAMSAAIARRVGLRTGLYTSPHLQDFRERIRVDGRAISEASVAAHAEQVAAALASLPQEQRGRVTAFEAMTALAWLHYRAKVVDLAVIEVGLGGRLDATNVLTPVACAIAPISYEHTEVLGSTLAQIAGEKAGILKPGVPAASAAQEPEARAVIAAQARRVGAPLAWVGEDWRAERLSGRAGRQTEHRADGAAGGTEFDIVGPEGVRYEQLQVSLQGAHQRENAVLAVALVHQGLAGQRSALRALLPQAVREGLATARWPGRFEVVGQRPRVVLDGAHNRASARRLAEALRDLPERGLVLVVGASGDKDLEGIFEELAPAARAVIVTRAAHPRSAPTERLAHVAGRFAADVQVTANVPEGVAAAVALASPTDVVCVTGSLFVVGEARQALGCPNPADEVL